MSPENRRAGNNWIGWLGLAGTVFTIAIWVGQKGVDSVLFIDQTKNINTDYPKFKELVVGKFDTIFKWRVQDKQEREDFYRMIQEDNRQFKNKTIEVVKEARK